MLKATLGLCSDFFLALASPTGLLIRSAETIARRRYRLLAVGLTTLIATAYVLTRRAGHAWGDDFAQYIQHALNILAGHPYRSTGHLLNPLNQIAPEVYPPVFPLLLVPIVAMVGPLDFETLKLVGIACFSLFLVVWSISLEADAKAEGIAPTAWPLHLLPLLMVVAASPVVWTQKDDLLSDLPFLLCQQLALWAIADWRRRSVARRPDIKRALLLGVALWLPYGCRTLGILLIGAFVLETAWLQWRHLLGARYEALALLICSMLMLAQHSWLASHDAGYGAQLRHYFNAAQVASNAHDYWAIACRFWGETPHLSRFQYTFLGAALALLVAWGWRRQWRRQPYQAHLIYSGAYTLSVLLWPMPQGARFLLPLLPLVVTYGWLGARTLPSHGGRWLPTALAMLLLSAGLADIKRQVHYPVPDRHDTAETAKLFTWVSHQPPGTVCLFWKPRALYLYTGHPAMVPTNLRDSALTEQDISRAGARFLIGQRDDSMYYPVRAHLRLETPHWRVLELLP